MNNTNPELQLAQEFVRDTDCNIFLTGRAGTGKTTFLHTLQQQGDKRMVVTAPTGVAAINAGGVTLHSFFQLPFGPFFPGSTNTRAQYRFSKKKINIIRSLDLLVIDEISMVRADVLDAVDHVLRRYRRSPLPFGGVQLLMIGDLFQLPPVVKDEEWQLLRASYSSPYFFSSGALSQTDMVTIELTHIYRQADSHFIALLNRVRDNSLTSSTLTELNHRCQPVPGGADSNGYITLCSHNRLADTINDTHLQDLSAQPHFFDAEVEGDFPEHTFPTAASLELKVGAQVMFMRNDITGEKRFFNGKIGRITHISPQEIRVKCPEDISEIVVEPALWENIDYSLDEETMEITENKIGAFSQYPLRLAWAITIHKSQGLTFDKAIIDAQAAFAHGQVYVALSRCRTLEGLVLASPLSPRAIMVDSAVLSFCTDSGDKKATTSHLQMAKIRYQQRLLTECFDFQRLHGLLRRLVFLVETNAPLLPLINLQGIKEMQQQVQEHICTVGANFLRQLHGLFDDTTLPTENDNVTERLNKASSYFQEKISALLTPPLEALNFETDNKELRKKISTAVNALREETVTRYAAAGCCQNHFSATDYFRAISAAQVDTTATKKSSGTTASYSEADIDHPELFTTLKEWRSQQAQEQNLAHYQVMHQKTLVQLAVTLPDSLQALLQVKGIGKRLAERYGDELVAMVRSYRKKHNIQQVVLPAPQPEPANKKVTTPRPKSQGNTRQLSLQLFDEGLSLPEIAKERGLVLSTIERHLAHFVEKGELSVTRLLSDAKIDTIEQHLRSNTSQSLSEIKLAVGTDISYSEIKLVQAHLKSGTTQGA